jgi:hypothetical protein
LLIFCSHTQYPSQLFLDIGKRFPVLHFLLLHFLCFRKLKTLHHDFIQVEISQDIAKAPDLCCMLHRQQTNHAVIGL